jgi:hypothetical protein
MLDLTPAVRRPATTPTEQLPRCPCQTDEWLRHLPAGSPAGSNAYNRHKYALKPKIKNKPTRPSRRPPHPLN